MLRYQYNEGTLYIFAEKFFCEQRIDFLSFLDGVRFYNVGLTQSAKQTEFFAF